MYQQEMAEKYGDLKRLEQELKAEGEALAALEKSKKHSPVRAASEGPLFNAKSSPWGNPINAAALEATISRVITGSPS